MSGIDVVDTGKREPAQMVARATVYALTTAMEQRCEAVGIGGRLLLFPILSSTSNTPEGVRINFRSVQSRIDACINRHPI